MLRGADIEKARRNAGIRYQRTLAEKLRIHPGTVGYVENETIELSQVEYQRWLDVIAEMARELRERKAAELAVA